MSVIAGVGFYQAAAGDVVLVTDQIAATIQETQVTASVQTVSITATVAPNSIIATVD